MSESYESVCFCLLLLFFFTANTTANKNPCKRSTERIKKFDPLKFKLAKTYCINLTTQINECVKTQSGPHMGNYLTHFRIEEYLNLI